MANEQNAAVTPKLFPSLQGTPAVAGQMTEESKNVFTELFGQDAAVKTGAVMNTVVQQQEKKNLSYFGDKPKEEISLKQFAKHRSHPAASFLQVSILLFLLTAGYFLTQNSTHFSIFGVNPALRVENFSEQVDQLEAEVRVQKYLAASLLLDQYVSLADEYLYNEVQANSVYASQNKRVEFEEAAAELKPQVVHLLEAIQVKMGDPIPSEELPASILVVDTLVNELRAQEGQVDNQALLQDIQDLQTSKAVLQNQSFQSLIGSLSLTDVSSEQIEAIFDSYNALNASSNSIISTIKAARPEWSTVIDAMEGVLKSVDPLFNTEFPGSLLVASVVFNADGSITISGNTSTSDTTNFTLASNLIDALEKSPYFMNVQNRSFQKSGAEQVYTGSFRIEMQLENNPTSHD